MNTTPRFVIKLRKIRRVLCCVLCAVLLFGLAAPASVLAADDAALSIIQIKPRPFVRKDGRQETDLTYRNSGAAFTAFAKVTVAGQESYIVPVGNLSAGSGSIILPVTDTNALLNPGETTTLTVEIYKNAACTGTPAASFTDKAWARTRHWQFYLSQEMHTDLGYTAYQENLKKIFSGYLDTVQTYMQNSDERESDLQKYLYAIESGYAMGDAYMQNRSADQIGNLLDWIKADRMTIGAGAFNFTMENFSAEETARAAYYTNRHLVDMLGIEPSTTQRMFDNPSFSKSYVDIAAEAGIKYGIHSMNPDRSPYCQKKQYDLFYMEGMNPENRLLIFNGKAYSDNYGFGGDHFSAEGSPEIATSRLLSLISELEARTGRNAYIYDKFPLPLVPYGDNQRPSEDQIIVANAVNKSWDDAGYAWPQITTAFPEQFFEEVEAEYGDLIPVETGTEENWWNDGWATTAYESGINKVAGNLIPVAETLSSFATLFAGKTYPYENLKEAVDRNLVYDEHTWGAAGYDGGEQYNKQFEWKRSNAFGAISLADILLDDAMQAMASTVATSGPAVYVYNPLNWVRNDVVTLSDLSDFPTYFEILDGDVSIPYTVEDGTLTFVAPDVPALGYKTFTVQEVSAQPIFSGETSAHGNVIQNAFYTVTFAADGTIASILDRKNGDRELVDTDAAEKFNQYRYYDDYGVPFANQGADFGPDKWDLYTPEEGAATLTVENSAVGATARLNTSTFRAGTIVQTVTLYDGLPRIDIKNEVVKAELPSLQSKEEAFYTFPFAASDGYEIRYDLPLGNVAEGEQVYGTSTDWYTVSKWISVQDKANGYNMVLATPDTGLAQFGERRTGSWSFDYKSENPYIYSYVMNNMWQTNFQGDQPGYVSFRYAVSTNTDQGSGENARFGYEISAPLQATVIPAAQTQSGTRPLSGSLLSVSADNVQLTTMKAAEANADGMILRFYEVTGQDTASVTVTLPVEAVSVYETDIIENDKSQVGSGQSFTFSIPAYGMKTFRIRFGTAPAKVTGLTAVAPDDTTINLSEAAVATASSYYADDYAPDNAKNLANGKDWASRGEKTAWYQLTWDTPVTIGSLKIADRPNADDNIDSVTLRFSDGSSQTVTDIRTDGTAKEVILDTPVTTTYVKAEIVGTTSCMNVGLSALETYGPDASAFRASGTQLNWQAADGSIFYEVFRSTDANFTPGSGNYLASVNSTSYFDAQVTANMEHTYYYKVRAVAAGAKGQASTAASPVPGKLYDTEAPDVPILSAQTRSGERIDLWWTPVGDNVALDHYEIWRNGVLIAETGDNYLVSYRDDSLTPLTTYTYTVKAVDANGNVAESTAVTAETFDTKTASLTGIRVSMGTISPRFNASVYTYKLNLSSAVGRTEDITVTATAASATAELTVNGKPVQSGVPSDPVAIGAAGDRIVIQVKEGAVTRSYTLTAGAGDPLILPAGAETGNQYDPEAGGQTPTHLIDGSGMSGQASLSDTHDNHNSAFTMWHTDANPGETAWVQVDLGDIYPLDEMYVWNLNQQNHTERGLKNVRIEYSLSGASWTELTPPEGVTFPEATDTDYPFQLAKASGQNGCTATNLNDGSNTPVSFDGAVARYVRITAQPEVGNGSWGEEYFGLSELRFTRKMVLSDILPVSVIRLSAAGGEAAITTPGGTLQLTAEVLPENATYKELAYTVTDEKGEPTKIAVVSGDGVVHARANGQVKVTATATDGSGVAGEITIAISGQPVILPGIAAKAGDEYDSFRGATNVVNDSGMSGTESVFDTHDNAQHGDTMWHTGANPGENAWIEFDLGSVQSIAEMWVWNMSQRGNEDRGLKQVKIEYRSDDADDWTELRGEGAAEAGEYPYTFAKAEGDSALSATNLENGRPVSFGVAARYVRITANPVVGEGSWGSEYYGLSEVRFTSVASIPDAETQAVIDKIAALPDTITPADLEEVAAARAAYNALTAEQQRMVTNLDKLLAAEKYRKRGDIDGDDKVTVSDVVELRKQIVAGDFDHMICDLDGDGSVTVSDVVELRKIIVQGG
ncbi:MAG: discoidin domain-containing protein [Candidatus Howiella sp.]|jgi:hypothetical protein